MFFKDITREQVDDLVNTLFDTIATAELGGDLTWESFYEKFFKKLLIHLNLEIESLSEKERESLLESLSEEEKEKLMEDFMDIFIEKLSVAREEEKKSLLERLGDKYKDRESLLESLSEEEKEKLMEDFMDIFIKKLSVAREEEKKSLLERLGDKYKDKENLFYKLLEIFLQESFSKGFIVEGNYLFFMRNLAISYLDTTSYITQERDKACGLLSNFMEENKDLLSAMLLFGLYLEQIQNIEQIENKQYIPDISGDIKAANKTAKKIYELWSDGDAKKKYDDILEKGAEERYNNIPGVNDCKKGLETDLLNFNRKKGLETDLLNFDRKKGLLETDLLCFFKMCEHIDTDTGSSSLPQPKM